MDFVLAFSNELTSLSDSDIPLSKAKMASITRAAMKALKFYKYIVQRVEKFIAKCPPQFKLPGLYIIDSIVRQSKHFYREKDVYGPRFLRNLVSVFISVLQCDEKDKPMVSHLLYLWESSSVFPKEVLYALKDIKTDPENPQVIEKAEEVVREALLKLSNHNVADTTMQLLPPRNHSVLNNNSTTKMYSMAPFEDTDKCTRKSSSARVQLLQLQALQKKIAEQLALLNQERTIDPELLTQIHILMSELTRRAEVAAAQLADKENADEDLSVIDPNILARLQSMVDTLAHTRALQEQLNEALAEHEQPWQQQQQHHQKETTVRSANGIAMQSEGDTSMDSRRCIDNYIGSGKHKTDLSIRSDSKRLIRPTTPPYSSDVEDESTVPQTYERKSYWPERNRPLTAKTNSRHLESRPMDDSTYRDVNAYHGSRKHYLHNSRQASYNHHEDVRVDDDGLIPSEKYSSSLSERNHNDDQNHLSKENLKRLNSDYEGGGYADDEDASSGQRCRKYSRLDSYDDRLVSHSTRSGFLESHNNNKLNPSDIEHDASDNFVEDYITESPMQSPAIRRRLDDSFFLQHGSPSSNEYDIVKHRERRRKHLGLPLLKPNHVGILSHTVFIGHLHKQIAESLLRTFCSEITEGQVVECNFIPPRGCAFVTFATRRAAHRAVCQMDRSTMNGRQVKVAWAPNLGVKSNEVYLANYWDTEQGCTYLPVEEFLKLTHSQFADLLDGFAEVDEESFNDARVRSFIRNTNRASDNIKTEKISLSNSPDGKLAKKSQTATAQKVVNTTSSRSTFPPVMSPVAVVVSSNAASISSVSPVVVTQTVPMMLSLVRANQNIIPQQQQQQQQPNNLNVANQQNRFPANNMCFPQHPNNIQSVLPRPPIRMLPSHSSWPQESSRTNTHTGPLVQSNLLPHIQRNENCHLAASSSSNAYNMQMFGKSSYMAVRSSLPTFPFPPLCLPQQQHQQQRTGLPMESAFNPLRGVLSGGGAGAVGGGVGRMPAMNNDNTGGGMHLQQWSTTPQVSLQQQQQQQQMSCSPYTSFPINSMRQNAFNNRPMYPPPPAGAGACGGVPPFGQGKFSQGFSGQ
ncbi:unnamed protein product [Trichobilharzia szidati]|nr:unnamed protein product [Trichobilharzia szidati]